MVTIDPCKRLMTIRTQLIPAMLTGAIENTSSDIKIAIEITLPSLEEKCRDLAEKCKKSSPDCGKDVELCNPENIRKVFSLTKERLEKIWKEQNMHEKQASGPSLL
ncbi:MAG: hypothetical protein O8C61_01140 [Candidatus Methanoperedens sp.]|nr:hypothetical protein [Candidatus Methanoperedens sp.]